MLVLGSAPLSFFGLGGVVTGLGNGLSGICVAGTMVTLGGSVVWVGFVTLGEGARQSGWHATAGVGCDALRAGAVGGLAVTLEKMQESVWMAAN